MSSNKAKRQENVGESNGNGRGFRERAESRVKPASPYERRWSWYQEWAASECVEHSFGPVITPEGRAQMEADRAANNNR